MGKMYALCILALANLTAGVVNVSVDGPVALTYVVVAASMIVQLSVIGMLASDSRGAG